MAPTLEQLERMSDAELRRAYNESAVHTQVGLEWYREEISRRRVERQTRRLEVLTCIIGALTAANVVLVAVDVL